MLQRATSRALLSVHRACVSAHNASSRLTAAQVPRASPSRLLRRRDGHPGRRRVWPEECKVEVDGKLYRRCAAALVFNTNGDVLVGERTDHRGPGACPGGIEVRDARPSSTPSSSPALTKRASLSIPNAPSIPTSDHPANDPHHPIKPSQRSPSRLSHVPNQIDESAEAAAA